MAQNSNPPQAENKLGLFERDDLLEISLRYDLDYFIKEKPDSLYLNAILTIHFSDLDSLNNNIKLRARGNYRYRTCMFPPIRLNFENGKSAYRDLDGQSNIKIVTHCDTSAIFEKYMLREYLVYKLYNIVSDYSLRVRLLRINYIDISGVEQPFTNYAFAIEPVKVLSERLGGTEIEGSEFGFKDLAGGQAELLSVFQYMIGNADWNLPLSHNIKFIDLSGSEEGKIAAIPYDFDYCGFVNTNYAQPRTDLGLEDITDRVYLGYCLDRQGMDNVLEQFSGYKDQFINTVRNFKYLDRAERKALEKYIQSFYNDSGKDLKIEKINKTCNKN